MGWIWIHFRLIGKGLDMNWIWAMLRLDLAWNGFGSNLNKDSIGFGSRFGLDLN